MMINLEELIEKAVRVEEAQIHEGADAAVGNFMWAAGRFSTKPEVDTQLIRKEAESRVAARISKLFMGY